MQFNDGARSIRNFHLYKGQLDEHDATMDLVSRQDSGAGDWLTATHVHQLEEVFWGLEIVWYVTIARPANIHLMYFGIVEHIIT